MLVQLPGMMVPSKTTKPEAKRVYKGFREGDQPTGPSSRSMVITDEHGRPVGTRCPYLRLELHPEASSSTFAS